MEEFRNKLLGSKLRKLRKYFNLSQKQCLQALGLSRQQEMSDLEKGNKAFTLPLTSKISEFFKVNPHDFNDPYKANVLDEFEQDPEKLKYAANDILTKLEVLRLQKIILMKDLELVRQQKQLLRYQYNAGKPGRSDPPVYVLI
ncbi:MAG TPA: helix-turn-helix transcriptional regulator [Bacteroidia bacterium]|nr:helix-turn-helix transcriptional regulator [Bacteroidia bacterium]